MPDQDLIADILDPEKLVLMDPLPTLDDVLDREQHMTFVTLYVAKPNATRAAKGSGYTDRSARSQGHRLLTRTDIKAALAVERERIRRRYDVTVEKIQAEYAAVGFQDLSDLDGVESLADLQELPREVRAAVQEINITETITRKDDESELLSRNVKIKCHPKVSALEGLAKINGMFTENLNVGGNVSVVIED